MHGRLKPQQTSDRHHTGWHLPARSWVSWQPSICSSPARSTCSLTSPVGQPRSRSWPGGPAFPVAPPVFRWTRWSPWASSSGAGIEYRNTPVAATYLSGQGPADLRPILRFWNRISYPTWGDLEEAIRSGQAPNRQGGGFSEEDQRIFSEGVGAFAAVPAEVLAASYDFSRHRRLLDLGGGIGSFLLPVLRRHAGLQGTLFELPGAAAVARQYLDQQPEAERIEVVAGDFFKDPIPTGP